MSNQYQYQQSPNGPLTQEAVDFLQNYRTQEGLSYATLGEHLGISQAFTHNIMNKGMNVSSKTYMAKIEAGIIALKNGNPSSGPLTKGEIKMLDHSYHLREGLLITVKLPLNLTSREAERLGQFIASLAQ